MVMLLTYLILTTVSTTIQYENTKTIELNFTRELDGYYIKDLVKAEFNYTLDFTNDKMYWSVTQPELSKYVSTFSWYAFVNETYDCDDRAYYILGKLSIPDYSALPIGYAVFYDGTNYHATVLFLDSMDTFWLIEYNSVFTIPENYILTYLNI